MSIQFIDRRYTVDVHPVSKGYSFEYAGKIHKSRTVKGVHNFFLQEYSSNRLDTVKLRFNDKKYYLHFTLDEPEKFTGKRALRSILAQENGGAWIEEKNGIKRYFIEDGWLFSNVREVSEDEYNVYQSSSLMQKVAQLALGVLSLVPLSTQASSMLSCYSSGLSLLGFSLLQVNPALAQMPAFGEFRINTNTTKFAPTTVSTGYGSRSYPKLIGLSNGGFIVAWTSNLQDGSGLEVCGQQYKATGFPEGDEFRTNTYSASDQYGPALAAFTKGGFVMAWDSFSQDGSGYGIYSQMYNASGFRERDEFRINTYTTGDQIYPALAALLDEGFVAAWESLGQNGFTYGIYGQRYNGSGFPDGTEFRINTNTTNDQDLPSLAGLKTGGFIVVWHADHTGDYDIYGQMYNASSFPDGAVFRINTNTTNNQIGPVIATLMNGNFVVVWYSLQNGVDYDIYGKIYNVFRVPQGSEFRINNNTINNQIRPTIAALINGGFAVAWQSDLQDGDGWGIYGRRYNSTGFPEGVEFRINTNTSNDQKKPTLAALSDGGFVIAWESNQNGVDSDIYGQRYDANGMPVINQSFPATSPLSSSFASSPTISSLTISSSSSLSASSSSAQTSPPSPSQTPSSFDSSSISQAYPSILSVTEISYGSSYPIAVNGVSVGTFEISGGTGLVSGSSSNTLTIYLNPDVDTQGTFTLFSIPQGQEGQFQTIELVGESCQSFEGSTTTDGSGQVVYQVIYQISTCASTGNRAVPLPFSAILNV